MGRAIAIVVIVMALVSVPAFTPPYEQCDQENFANANPGLCEPDTPFPTFPPNAGDRDDGGGLIGRILRGLF